MKRIYLKPVVETVKLDNQIALQMASVQEASNPYTEPTNWSRSKRVNDDDPYYDSGW